MPVITLQNQTDGLDFITALDGGGFVAKKVTANGTFLTLFEADGAGFAKVGGDIEVPSEGTLINAVLALPEGGFAVYFVHVDNTTPTPVRSMRVATYDGLGIPTGVTTVADENAAESRPFTNSTVITTGFEGLDAQHWLTRGVTEDGLALTGIAGATGLTSGDNRTLDGWNSVAAGVINASQGLDGGLVAGVVQVGSALQLVVDRVGGGAAAPSYAYAGKPWAGRSITLAEGNCLLFDTLGFTGSGATATVSVTLSVVAPDEAKPVTITFAKPNQKAFVSYAEIDGFGFAAMVQFVDSATGNVTSAEMQFYSHRGINWQSQPIPALVGKPLAVSSFAVLDPAGNDDLLRTVLTWREDVTGTGQTALLGQVFEFSHFSRMEGTVEADHIRGFGDQDAIGGGGGNDLVQGFGGRDGVDGGEGNDTVDGGDGNDGVSGGAGDDRLLGGSGDDTMEGNAGLDLMLGDTGDDLMTGGDGDDQLEGNQGSDKLHGDGGDDGLIGGAGRDRLFGDAGDDNIGANEGADALFGGIGNDTLFGEDGDDEMSGGAGDDHLLGGAGIDKLRGEAGDDALEGEAGNDLLLGGDGNDDLDGGAGNDTLQGNGGSDVLTGGAGADRFVFLKPDEFLAGGFADTISDFSAAERDKIDLSALDARTDRGGNNAFHGVADFTGQSGELRLVLREGELVVQGDRNGDKTEDFSLILTGVLSLQQSDFVL